MADYKAIHGKNILHLASDLDTAEGEGQLWFNTTSSDYKTIVKVAGAWATGGAINTARRDVASGGAGIQTAALCIGGDSPAHALVELYNGSSWSEVGDLNKARANGGAAGLSTAALAFGGTPPVSNETEVWDGSTWTEVADLGTANNQVSGGGTAFVAISAGGESPNNGATYEWNVPSTTKTFSSS